ncbi:hypothetical protein EV121DRAFT_275563 [Schizophyllum commune]
MRAIARTTERIFNPFQCSIVSLHPSRFYRRTPVLPPEIWLEIFQFATYVHHEATIEPMDPFTLKNITHNIMGENSSTSSLRMRCTLPLVCKEWHQLSLRLLYRHIVVRSPARARQILRALEAHPAQVDMRPIKPSSTSYYGQWTRHIEIYTHARGSSSMSFLQDLARIFLCCPNVRMLSAHWMHSPPKPFLDCIARVYGSTLEGIYWKESLPMWLAFAEQLDHWPSSPAFLGSFQNLRVLDLRHFRGQDPGRLLPSQQATPKPTLPCVTSLVLSTEARSLAAAQKITFPALSRLTLYTAPNATQIDDAAIDRFLQAHGANITVVDLPTPSRDAEPEPAPIIGRRAPTVYVKPDLFLKPDRCPLLDTLVFAAGAPELEAYGHSTLRRVGIRGVRADSLYPSKAHRVKTHLQGLTRALYPRLEVVRTVGFLVEADVDSLIKDIFIWWTEKFEKDGVDFQDGEGVVWLYTDPVVEEGAADAGAAEAPKADAQKVDAPK